MRPTSYLGHGDLVGTYRWHGHEFSVLARRNRSTGRGALQAGWALPLLGEVKGDVQVFTGDGDSLINDTPASRRWGSAC